MRTSLFLGSTLEHSRVPGSARLFASTPGPSATDSTVQFGIVPLKCHFGIKPGRLLQRSRVGLIRQQHWYSGSDWSSPICHLTPPNFEPLTRIELCSLQQEKRVRTAGPMSRLTVWPGQGPLQQHNSLSAACQGSLSETRRTQLPQQDLLGKSENLVEFSGRRASIRGLEVVPAETVKLLNWTESESLRVPFWTLYPSLSNVYDFWIDF
jgi:hypothetical protein